MRDVLVALYQLQEIDSRALEFERSASQLPAKIAELESGVDELRTETGALHTEIDTKAKEQNEAEVQIREETEKIRKWKRRLNDIRTPREYQALSRETEQLERVVRSLEETVVELMEQREAQQAVIDEKETELRERESLVAAEVKVIREKQAALRREGEIAKRGRDEIIGKLPARYFKLYEKTRKQRRGLAVVTAVGTSCSGCHFVIRAQLLVEMRKLESIQTCPNCSRILVPDSLAKEHDEQHEQPKQAEG